MNWDVTSNPSAIWLWCALIVGSIFVATVPLPMIILRVWEKKGAAGNVLLLGSWSTMSCLVMFACWWLSRAGMAQMKIAPGWQYWFGTCFMFFLSVGLIASILHSGRRMAKMVVAGIVAAVVVLLIGNGVILLHSPLPL